MRVLALDTASARCAVAVSIEGETVASVEEPMARGQAERLIPLAQSVLAEHGLRWRDLNRIAVGVGPGNFTGIRIAVSAARGLALALDIPAIGISAFDALAFGAAGPVLVTLDAKRDRLFVQGAGGVDLAPRQIDWRGLHHLDLPAGTRVLGHRAREIAALLRAEPGAEADIAPPGAYAALGAAAPPPFDAPAPLYLRSADAAPPAKPVPVLLNGT
ncbi:MAG: tRNA (adenosine(37)-N6)-threonylcarbamoyltransferase complex dimerization subunit type 1 TsaB [Pseudomonadota bacterium]